MKKLLMLLAASLLGSGAYAQHLGTEYRLKKLSQVPAQLESCPEESPDQGRPVVPAPRKGQPLRRYRCI